MASKKKSGGEQPKRSKSPGVREQIRIDRELITLRASQSTLKRKYAELLRGVAQSEKALEAMKQLSADVAVHKIDPKTPTNTSEATAVLVASDWHVEERVRREAINGLNEYNLEIARKRGDMFFQSGLRLTNIMAQDVTIKTVVLALLGDFITNDIHDEMPENNLLLPAEAIRMAQEMIVSGINFLLNNSKVDLVIPCHSGNHGRTTKQVHIASEHGHSLEYLMYHAIAAIFANEKRVKFIISEGYHSYVHLYDNYTIRFHHGHNVRYQGGVGGITIPVNKAIAEWDKACRANLDVFGHFHQYFPAPKFVCNGSMIGYNAFALSIKAACEKPQQAFFLVDKKRGRTITAPILFDESVKK
jgi:hypothetical protein